MCVGVFVCVDVCVCVFVTSQQGHFSFWLTSQFVTLDVLIFSLMAVVAGCCTNEK